MGSSSKLWNSPSEIAALEQRTDARTNRSQLIWPNRPFTPGYPASRRDALGCRAPHTVWTPSVGPQQSAKCSSAEAASCRRFVYRMEISVRGARAMPNRARTQPAQAGSSVASRSRPGRKSTLTGLGAESRCESGRRRHLRHAFVAKNLPARPRLLYLLQAAECSGFDLTKIARI